MFEKVFGTCHDAVCFNREGKRKMCFYHLIIKRHPNEFKDERSNNSDFKPVKGFLNL